MCGIVGYVGRRPGKPIILDGLRRLEYRGYDSAGLALMEDDGLGDRAGRRQPRRAHRRRRQTVPAGLRGPRAHALGDARPAVRGERPPARRLHAAASRIVLNGIIENYKELRAELTRRAATPSPPRPTPRSWPT